MRVLRSYKTSLSVRHWLLAKSSGSWRFDISPVGERACEVAHSCHRDTCIP